jgi:hypothetical protein
LALEKQDNPAQKAAGYFEQALELKRQGKLPLLGGFMHTEIEAAKYIAEADKLMAQGTTSWAGYKYRHGGMLYEQMLCFDAQVFNLETGDYTIPTETDGLYVVPVDFHY